MKISPYLKINRIEFIVTYRCTGSCMHCSVGDRINRKDEYSHVDKAAAANTIRELSKLFSISSVMTFGGEPLLYPDVVCEIHRTAAECGIEKRQLITNGCFTGDERLMDAAAYALSAAGVNELLLSADAFHQQNLPIVRVMKFAECAKAAKIPDIRVQPAWVINEKADNHYNRKTKRILKEFSKLNIPISSGNDIFMAGRAAKFLAEFYPPPCLDLSEKCGSMPYTEPLTDITSVSIEPNGDMKVCGFVLGNIYTENIEQIVAEFDPYNNVYMNALISGGGEALLEAAMAEGLTADTSNCYSICDICNKITDLTK